MTINKIALLDQIHPPVHAFWISDEAMYIVCVNFAPEIDFYLVLITFHYDTHKRISLKAENHEIDDKIETKSEQ